MPGVIHPVYTPGQAKLIKAGSTITFQLHYTTTGKPEEDRTRIGLIFAKEPPKVRIKSILLYNRNFVIPGGSREPSGGGPGRTASGRAPGFHPAAHASTR